MNNKYLWIVLVIIIIVVVLGLGGFLLLSNKTSNTNRATTGQNQNLKPTNANIAASAVSVTNAGFEPKTISIKAGTRVVWTNKSGSSVTVNSDPHPTHTLWPFLNLGEFNDGSSVSVVFEKPGTYTYHNNFNAEQKGTVIVE